MTGLMVLVMVLLGQAWAAPSALELADAVADCITADCEGRWQSEDSYDCGSDTFYYRDEDGDDYRPSGLGTCCVGEAACLGSDARPSGWKKASDIESGTDCDDDNAARNPGESEVCDGFDNVCDGSIPSNEVDNDGDGYVECSFSGTSFPGDSGVVGGNDCDDTSSVAAWRSPGRTEECDGIDNDCSGSPEAVENDDDGDGYAECTVTTWRGSVTKLGDDCDDTSDQVNPGASEVCDGVDSDCSGSFGVDEIDNDGDGYVECDPASYDWLAATAIAGGNDCDDANSRRNPGYTTEVCDGYDNTCDGSTPGNEIDNDGDGYVECTYSGEFPGSTDVVGGGDCNDSCATCYPRDSYELCDGVDNDCDGLVDDEDTLTSGAADLYFLDGDGDGYGLDSETASACSVPSGYSDISGDCDDDHAFIYPGAPELCDGVVTNCTTRSTGGGLDSTEIDLDGDGYVACDYDGTIEWVGSGSINVGLDCAPSDPRTYPYADETCDGVYNDCTARSSPEATDEAPANETDNDGDGFVECYDGSTTWRGTPEDASDDPEAGQDCDDRDATVYPDAPELCDGVFNDCEDPVYGSVSAPDPERDLDEDGYIECSYDAVTWKGTAVPLGGDDCEPNDGEVYPSATETCDGRYNNCSDPDRLLRDAPAREVDDDGDSYVECSYASSTWVGDPLVIGGLDCDDADAATYPGAAEVCDGQYNNCSDFSWVADDAPPAEWDNDGDGFVECVRRARVVWNPWDGVEPEPNLPCADAGDDCFDCDDGDAETYPGAAWAEDDLACMRDGDVDGYGDMDLDSDDEDAGIQAGSDCNDGRDDVHPLHPEECEDGAQIDNDCDGSYNTFDGEPIEDGGVPLYVDADRDGHGAAGSEAALYVCEDEEGFSSDATDCDDEDPSRHPGAIELCNNVDDDCDTQVDEAGDLDGSVSGCVDMYRDADRDGYGDGTASMCLCLAGDETSTNEGGYAWVQNPGDCDDLDENVHPMSCRDGLDQDGDGLADDLDPDCQVGLDEWGLELEVKRELLDGNDDDCDGYVPMVELDCDDDGALAASPVDLAAAEADGVYLSVDLGLASCSESAARSRVIRCWEDEPVTVECDGETGLWVLRLDASPDGFGGRFEGGRRVYQADPVCTGLADCDDRCDARCPGRSEVCDGIDNDCSDVRTEDGEAWDLGSGVPASMEGARGVAGTVPVGELDLDGDGFLACDLLDGGEQQWTAASCEDMVEDAADEPDCNDRCSASAPGAAEACNGFADTCDGEGEGADSDRDGFAACGLWSGAGADVLEEQVYVVAHFRDVAAFEAGADTAVDTAAGDTAADTAVGGAAAGDTAADSGDTGSGLAADHGMAPLLLPRFCPDGAGGQQLCACDQPLYDGLVDRLGQARVDQAIADADPFLLLDACDDGGCAVVRLVLSRDVDDETWDRWVPDARAAGLLSAECDAAPEQLAVRTVWSRQRILDARELVVEAECRALYGRSCAEVDESSVLVSNWRSRVAVSDAALRARAPWVEIARFAPETVDDGTVGWCWGDPTDLDADLADTTGGDCADGADPINRDAAEGPGDVVGLIAGDPASCDTCVDGLDNNCDGRVDCADPACAACFVGQGAGCGGGSASPCAQSGCSAAPAPDDRNDLLVVIGGLLLAGLRRRRRTAA